MTSFDGRHYQAQFDALADQGVDVHGEATFVRARQPSSVLDAGCGTGRVAIELARQGIDVVGADVDSSMIAEARRRAPDLSWVQADLVDLDLGRTFDVVLLADNVPLFCAPGTEPRLVSSCAAHVGPGGLLIVGFGLGRGYELDAYDADANAAGMVLAERWATWDEKPFVPNSAYAVSVHRR